jgi:hypothetical protein
MLPEISINHVGEEMNGGRNSRNQGSTLSHKAKD